MGLHSLSRMKRKRHEPGWQTGLNVFFSIAIPVVAIPAMMDGHWLLAGVLIVGSLVLEVAILLAVGAVLRRRDRRHRQA